MIDHLGDRKRRFAKAIWPFHVYPGKHDKTLEKAGFSRFAAICRNVSKRAETRASGSKYYRPKPGELVPDGCALRP
jgi:hypothetical protein